jgi:uncharacterized phage-associated protein
MFDGRTTTQVAAYFLHKAGGSMNYTKLLKLMYLADRRSWDECEEPITGDRVVAMKNGPVLLGTYHFIKATISGGASSYWSELVAADGRDDVKLKRQVSTPKDFGCLSETIIGILDRVFDEFGGYSKEGLIDHTHTFDEWQKSPAGCDEVIPTKDILAALGKPPSKIKDILQKAERIDELAKDLAELLKVNEDDYAADYA